MENRNARPYFRPNNPRPRPFISQDQDNNEDWAEKEDREMLRKINPRPGAWRRIIR